jgi:hypothetical protein
MLAENAIFKAQKTNIPCPTCCSGGTNRRKKGEKSITKKSGGAP